MLGALIELACHRDRGRTNAGVAPPASPERSIELLGKTVHLPITPVEVWFEDIPEGTPGGLGPTDYMLVAVLRFDRAALTAFTKGRAADGQPPARILSSANRPWLPPAVKNAIRPHDTSSVVVRGTQFDGAPFASGAFSAGSFVVVEGGEYVVLVLGTS